MRPKRSSTIRTAQTTGRPHLYPSPSQSNSITHYYPKPHLKRPPTTHLTLSRTAFPTHLRATLTANSKSSTHPHLRCTAAARWRREVRSGGVAGEGVEGGPGGLLAGPDRPQPR